MPSTRTFAAIVAACSTALMAYSCNSYDLVMHDRFEQAAFNSDVDILWVVDNSNSMEAIQDEVQQNFGSFISSFANVSDGEGIEYDYDNIYDATLAWAEFNSNQERFLNYHMGVVTTDMSASGNGNQGNIRSASNIGAPECGSPSVITPQSENPAGEFINLVDVGVNGAGDEQAAYAAAIAMCKGKDASWWSQLDSRADTDPVKIVCSQVPADQRACNEGFFRSDAASVVIVVSDEGDDTERLETLPPPADLSACVEANNDDPFFGECDCRVSWWLDFFEGIGQPVVFANIGPTYQFESDDSVTCDGSVVNYPGPCNRFGSTTCSVEFHQEMSCHTGGLFTPIEETTELDNPTTCQTANFESALGNIGALVSNLSRSWVLSTIPDEDTIVVVRNDDEVIPRLAESPSGGWVYRPQTRSVAFRGEALPSYEDVIDIYYLPQHDRSDTVGRPLPF